jgi:hypothetical protein
LFVDLYLYISGWGGMGQKVQKGNFSSGKKR